MPRIKKLKIGLLIDDTLDTPDGVQQYVLTLGKWLSKQGHEVHYLVGQSDRRDIHNMHTMARNVHVRFNKNRLSIPLPANKKLITATLAKLNLDVLHIQMPYSPMFAGRVIKLIGPNTKLIGTFHIVPANWFHTAGAHCLKIFNHRTIKQFDQILSVSQPAADFARRVFGIESIIIPNPINLKAFKRQPVYNKTLKIIFLGRLVERKGCQYLIRSLAQLQKQYRGRYQVLIAGQGPLADKLKNLAAKNNVKKIKFIGFVQEKNKPALLASADIAVFPSTGGESFGISIIEAMAAGSRVVLGGDNAGYRTILSDNPNLLINPRDTISFANRLQYFLEHQDVRETTFKWLKANIGQYDIELVGKRILRVYKKDF